MHCSEYTSPAASAASPYKQANTHPFLSCCLFNVQSLVNKWDEFHRLIYGGSSELFLVSETWLSDDVNSGLIDPLSQYTIIRKDRGTSRYGGVAALISRQFDVSEIDVDVSFRISKLFVLTF